MSSSVFPIPISSAKMPPITALLRLPLMLVTTLALARCAARSASVVRRAQSDLMAGAGSVDIRVDKGPHVAPCAVVCGGGWVAAFFVRSGHHQPGVLQVLLPPLQCLSNLGLHTDHDRII